MNRLYGLAAVLIAALSPLSAQADAPPEPTPDFVQISIEGFCAPIRPNEPRYVASERDQYRYNLGFSKRAYPEAWQELPRGLRSRGDRIIENGRLGCTP